MSTIITEEPFNLLGEERLVVREYERIGRFFPKAGITLVKGLPGTGKTSSVLNELILDGIRPIWFNLDESPAKLQGEDLSRYAECFSGGSLLKLLVNLENIDGSIDGSVIVIDTHERMSDIIGKANNIRKRHYESCKELSPVYVLRFLAKKHGCTVVIIGHTEHHVGSSEIFVDKTLERRADEVIYLEVKKRTEKKDGVRHLVIERSTYLIKRRGTDLGPIITDFGNHEGDKPKEEVINEMTDETGGGSPTSLEAMLEEDESIIRHHE